MTTDTAVEPSAGTGLLDNVNLQDDTNTESKDAVAIDHKTPENPAGSASDTGAPKTKPDYLPDNFWNAEKGEANLEAMSKSWADLRKQISQGKHKAPEDGNYDVSSFGENATENPMAQTLVGWAKENGLSQAQFDDLSRQLQEKAKELVGGETVDAAAEMKKLGPNGGAMVNGMADWARGLIAKGTWGQEDWDEFKIMAGTARGITMLAKLREMYEGRMPIETAPLDGVPTKDELYAMVADPKYKTDAAYRQKVEKMFAQVVKD